MGRFAGLVALALTACRVLDEGHCANGDGDASCSARGVGLDYCDRCVAHDDGCVAEPPTATECAVGGTAASTDDTTAALDDGELESSTAIASSGSSTTTGGDGTTASSAASSSSTDEGESSSTTQSLPTCGDGMVDDGEACDGDALGGLDCAGLPEFAGGTLACDASCELDTTACTPCVVATAPCGSDAECCGESCSGLGLCL